MEAKVDRTQDMIAGINDSISQSAENTGELAAALKNLQQRFTKRQMEGGIESVAVRNPQSPVDHYYNACLFSKMGDHKNATKAYKAYFADELPVVDPHLNFVSLLKVQEGLEGARAIYDSMPGDRESVGRKLAMALLETDDRRSAALEQVVAKHPNCSPAVYLLSQQFSPEGNQLDTLSNRRRQQELLDQFVSLNEQGQLLPYYLDQSIAVGQLNQAKNELKKLAVSAAAPNHIPVNLLSAHLMGTYWRIELGLEEKSTEIFWATDENGEFESTGPALGVRKKDARTGKLHPSPFFKISARKLLESGPNTQIHVKYADAKGKMQGPFALDFDPQAEAKSMARRAMGNIPRSWARFQEDELVFRLFLKTDIRNIDAVDYALNNEVPNLSMPVPRRKYSHATKSEYSLPVDETVKFASLQVTYTDGTKSKVVRIDRE